MSRIEDGKLVPRRAPKKKTKQRKPGLLFPALRVEIEIVRGAHKACCVSCTELPEGRRVKVTQGSGKNGVVSVLCIACGVKWLRQRRQEVTRAITYLATGKGEIRS